VIPLLTTIVAQYGLTVPRRWAQWQFPLEFNPETTGMRLLAGFLVSVPVFIQAPLVRQFPWISLGLTLVWMGVALWLMRLPRQAIWGDLLLGFSWSWLAGTIYWGWFRWEPLWHLPIESLGLPFAIWGIQRRWGMIGHLFYLGSLCGTAVTDAYFYLTGLMEYWRQVMVVEPALIPTVFQAALASMETPWGIGWAMVLVILLVGLGGWAWQKTAAPWQAFAGAVLSTILVDGLFWVAAMMS
jgi:hypothetical protein